MFVRILCGAPTKGNAPWNEKSGIKEIIHSNPLNSLIFYIFSILLYKMKMSTKKKRWIKEKGHENNCIVLPRKLSFRLFSRCFMLFVGYTLSSCILFFINNMLNNCRCIRKIIMEISFSKDLWAYYVY